MKLIISDSNNPYYNLALEEWAVRNIDTSIDSYLFLYQNTDAVVVGRNQNIFQEANLNFCTENKIRLCRRVSGGGTVYHDMGNLNWTFISAFETEKINNYSDFAAPIITVLKLLGLDAFLNQRNAIMIGKTKVSGQAQFTNRNNILSHGTLLLASDTDKLENSTINKRMDVKTQASPSVRSKVKNIEELLNRKIDINNIKELIKKTCSISNNYILSTKELDAIKVLEKKYQTTAWIFERASKCSINLKYQEEELLLQIEKAKVVSIRNKKGVELNLHPLLNRYFHEISKLF